MTSLPITAENVREWFPAPSAESPFCGEPWWTVQSVGLVMALTIMRHTPDSPARQQALVELRRALDTALLEIPAPDDEEVRRRLAQTLAPYVPTPMDVVDGLLTWAGVEQGDVVYDLGSGDGRVVFEACRLGAVGVGIEIDAMLVAQCNDRVPDGMPAVFVHGDATEVDFSDANVVVCYLLSSSMDALSVKFRALKPGTVIVSHGFGISDWPATMQGKIGESSVFKWVV
jgi:SAM-dependent methyltransferase